MNRLPKTILAMLALTLLVPAAAWGAFVVVGLDFTKGTGVVLVESAGQNFRALDVPALQGKWFILGAAAAGRGGDTLLYGMDKANGTGLLLRLSGDSVKRVPLPRLGQGAVLSAATFPSRERALIVGYTAAGQPLCLAGSGDSWAAEQLPQLPGRVELLDVAGNAQMTLAVGVNRTDNRGVLLLRRNGSWSAADLSGAFPGSFRFEGVALAGDGALLVGSQGQLESGLIVRAAPDGAGGLSLSAEPLPEVAHSWTLYDVWSSADGSRAWAVGADLSNSRGLILSYADGKWSAQTVDERVELISVSGAAGGRAAAVGQDEAKRQGVLMLFDGKAWRRAKLPEVSFNWMLTGIEDR